MQYTLDTVDSLLECDAEETDKVKSLRDTMLSFCLIQRNMEQVDVAAKLVINQAKSTREQIEKKLTELQRASTDDSLKNHAKVYRVRRTCAECH